jgi:hypothetical protein
MQLNLTILTKTKEKQSATANRSDKVAKALSIHISIILTQVSIPTEDGSQ